MQTVRVATFEGPGEPPMIREVPKPEVPPKAGLIRIAACGVCGTDLHILKGQAPAPPPGRSPSATSWWESWRRSDRS